MAKSESIFRGKSRKPAEDPEGRGWDAHLDPWCNVDLKTGETVLFGFALVHPKTGGLGWTNSSHVVSLNTMALTALTRSGRRYLLGRYFKIIDVSGEGQEARAAFELLLGDEAEVMQTIRLQDSRWVMACKVARHLLIPPPARIRAEVEEFIKENHALYLRLRMSRDAS